MGKFLVVMLVLGVVGFVSFGVSTDWEFAKGEEKTRQELALERVRGFTGGTSYGIDGIEGLSVEQIERYADDASYAIEGLGLERIEKFANDAAYAIEDLALERVERYADDASYVIEGLARDHVDQFTNDASEAIDSFFGW